MSNNHLDRVIPLPEAAERLGIPAETLTRLAKNGIIKAVQLPTGEIAVSEEETQITINRKDYDHLRGQRITVSEATKKYKIPGMTIRHWINREYVAVLKEGYGMQLDEADVAYCAALWRERKKVGSRSPLFDEVGRPYQLKHPDLSEYRRRKKRTNQSPQKPTQIAKGKTG